MSTGERADRSDSGKVAHGEGPSIDSVTGVAKPDASGPTLAVSANIRPNADVAAIPSRKPVRLSVVVPIYNEEEVLWGMAEGLAPSLDEVAEPGCWQFVLVDNGSKDGSAAVCEKIVARWPQSVVVRLDRPDYGEALYQGLMHAAGPWAFIINADFWDVPFIRWCFKTRGVYDLVMGSKRADHALNQQDNYRRLLSWGLNTILQTIFGFVGSDTHGQKFLYLPALRPIFAQCVMRRGQFDTEFTLRASRARLWLAEVPVPIVELRRPRNLMFHKIIRNMVDIRRLHRLMREVPMNAAARYHRWSREDVEGLDSTQTALIIEMGRLHRRDTILVDSVLTGANAPDQPQASRAERGLHKQRHAG
jgi:Glycosyl transferase family 2